MASAEGSRDVEYNTAVRWLTCVRAIGPEVVKPDDMMLNRTPDPDVRRVAQAVSPDRALSAADEDVVHEPRDYQGNG
jgi:hypothetical protein